MNRSSVVCFIIIFLVFFGILALSFYIPQEFNFYGKPGESYDLYQYQIYYYCWTIAISLFLLWVAYFNLEKIAEDRRASFLLELAKLWRTDTNTAARAILYEYKLKNKNLFGDELHLAISKELLKIKHNSRQKDKFMNLLGLLDFWETIGYFLEKGYLTIIDINELCGGSIQYHYKVMKPMLDEIRNECKKNDDQGAPEEIYKWFESVYQNVLDEQRQQKNLIMEIKFWVISIAIYKVK